MVHNIKYLISLIFLMMAGCSSQITERDLVGGNWQATAGYEDGEPVGEPYCMDFFTGGLEFKEDGIVYGEEYNKDYEYELEEWEGRIRIVFNRNGKNRHNYFIDKISADEIGLTGSGRGFENESCYLEREK